MNRARKKYTIVSLAAICVITAITVVALNMLGKVALSVPTIVLGVYFCLLNAASIYARSSFKNNRDKSIMTYYLIDKAARFVMSLMVIGVLIYAYKGNNLVLGMISFSYYIIAMALEISFFVAVEKNKTLENA